MIIKNSTTTAAVHELLRGGASAVDETISYLEFLCAPPDPNPSRARRDRDFGSRDGAGPRVQAHLDLLLNVRRAGGYRNYVTEARYSLVVLRALVVQDRASSRDVDARLFSFPDDRWRQLLYLAARGRLFSLPNVPSRALALILKTYWL